jgi:Holliday junction resolvasome RuvABC endonuclease subunit
MRIAIDPSNTCTGWAVSDNKNRIISHGNIKQKSLGGYYCKLREVLREITATHGAISIGYLENPKFQPAGKGIIAAKSGSLVKLSMVAGVLKMALEEFCASVELVEISSWKGQLNGDLKYNRIIKEMEELRYENEKMPKADSIDACGILLWAFKKSTDPCRKKKESPTKREPQGKSDSE